MSGVLRLQSYRDDVAPSAALPLGAMPRPDGTCSFCVWAPATVAVHVHLHDDGRRVAMEPGPHGYYAAVVEDVRDGSLYSFQLDDADELPDPASRAQPLGVHGPSRVTGPAFPWAIDEWPSPDLADMVLYELHVGTFTPEGTFDAALERLPKLRELGITAIELMPVAQFPGTRNWGYDGACPFAVQWSYGGVAGLKRFIDAAHALQMHVVLDVVYNHLGPEGNYLRRFGPYFNPAYQTPWGEALNFDGADSDDVRRFFVENALQWIDEFRIDGLRLDAVHAIVDRTAQPFLQELAAAVHERARHLGRRTLLIAESDLADPRIIRPVETGGLGLDAQWLDDFHHALRTLLTGEDSGYYTDYGTLDHLARAYRDGYVYAGQYSAFRRRRHGAPARDVAPQQFVVFLQNHDQTGNRMGGDRLSTEIGFEQLKLAAAAVTLGPFTPLLFMGEEYGERRPFPYFVSHGDLELVEAVRTGRREEFASFLWEGEPPDPQAEDTFRTAILDWEAREREPHASLLRLYCELLGLRRAVGSSTARATTTAYTPDGSGAPADARTGILVVRCTGGRGEALLMLNFAATTAHVPLPDRPWDRVLDTSDARWLGPAGATRENTDTGARRAVLRPHSAALFVEAGRA